MRFDNPPGNSSVNYSAGFTHPGSFINPYRFNAPESSIPRIVQEPMPKCCLCSKYVNIEDPTCAKLQCGDFVYAKCVFTITFGGSMPTKCNICERRIEASDRSKCLEIYNRFS